MKKGCRSAALEMHLSPIKTNVKSRAHTNQPINKQEVASFSQFMAFSLRFRPTNDIIATCRLLPLSSLALFYQEEEQEFKFFDKCSATASLPNAHHQI